MISDTVKGVIINCVFMEKGKPFYIVIKDNDTKEFNLVGPVADDTLYVNKIVAEQKKGRNITCDTSHDKEGAITTFIDYGYKYVPEKAIIG